MADSQQANQPYTQGGGQMFSQGNLVNLPNVQGVVGGMPGAFPPGPPKIGGMPPRPGYQNSQMPPQVSQPGGMLPPQQYTGQGPPNMMGGRPPFMGGPPGQRAPGPGGYPLPPGGSSSASGTPPPVSMYGPPGSINRSSSAPVIPPGMRPAPDGQQPPTVMPGIQPVVNGHSTAQPPNMVNQPPRPSMFDSQAGTMFNSQSVPTMRHPVSSQNGPPAAGVGPPPMTGQPYHNQGLPGMSQPGMNPVLQPGIRLPMSQGGMGPPMSQAGMGPPPMSQASIGPPPTSQASMGPPMSQAGMGPPPMLQAGMGPPPTSQAGMRPPMPQTGMGPPPMSQAGIGPPPMSQAGMRPPMSQAGMRPPPMSQAGMGPPPMSQLGGAVPANGPLMAGSQAQMRPGMMPSGPSGAVPVGGLPPPGMRYPGPPPSGTRPSPTTTGPSLDNTNTPGRPSDLPAPFQGQGQYSQPGSQGDNLGYGLTPSSETPSQKSSRAPSPVPGQQYDALEGQFSPQNQGPPAVGSNYPGQVPLGGGMPPPPSGQDMNRSGISGRRQYPQMAAQPGYSQAPPPQMSGGMAPGPVAAPNNVMPGRSQLPGQSPQMGYQPPNNTAQVTSGFSNMKLQPDATRPLNLLQERHLIPSDGVEIPLPNLPHDFKKVNCSPEIFRCTVNAIPNTQSLLNKSRLPLGILIHPFKDLADIPVLSIPEPTPYETRRPVELENQLPVIQSSVIVRCRSCRTYINPFVSFVDMRRWKCNLCYRVNELPEEFNYDPVSKSYGEPQRRPEIRSATIEFIAPSEYMLRPPQPAVYLFVLDVSFNAVGIGYLQSFCQTLMEEIDRIPGDARTQIGFITFDSSVQFYNLSEGLSQPQMLVVSDVDEVFLPSPDNLLVNLQESKDLIADLLSKLPEMFEKNTETGSALGAALQAAYKLMSATGGRVSVFQTQLPTVGPGALKCREDPNERSGKKVNHLGPATDFYKKLSLDCSAQQIAVDLFMLNSQYTDIATVAGVSKYSGGCLYHFPGYHSVSQPAEVERFEGTLRRYFTRKIGFEAVMRIRCTRGLSIHTFHGNFFVRSTDLLSLPNVNPDSGFGMQMSIEDTLDCTHVCFQAALLYTSSKGERRIRVHTLCLPVTQAITDIYASADQQAIIGLLSKMAVDKSLSSMGDARDAAINAAIDMLGAYGGTLTAAQRMGQLPCPYTLRLVPLYILSMLKSTAFRVGSSTKLDDRVFALECCKNQPLVNLLWEMHPDLYPVHSLDDRNGLDKGEVVVPQPPLLQLSSANIDRHGAYLMDTGTRMYLWIGAAISDKFCQDVLDVPNFASIPEGLSDLPDLDNPTSDRMKIFISHLNDLKPCPAGLLVLREDSRQRMQFISHMVEDRTESTMSYYEFLQHLQKEVKS